MCHYTKHIGITDKHARATLLEKYQRNKKARYDGPMKGSGSMGRITYTPTSPHTSIFKASFTKGTVEADLMTDQGRCSLHIYSVARKDQEELVGRPGKSTLIKSSVPRSYRRSMSNLLLSREIRRHSAIEA